MRFDATGSARRCGTPLLVLSFCLTLTQAAPPTVAELYQPGEEIVWVFEEGGERIGDHAFRYEGVTDLLGAGAHRFTARVHLEATPALPVEQRYQAELWTDEAGHPLRHVLQAEVGESYSRVELTVSGGTARARVVQGPSSQDVEVQVPAGSFLQANNFIGYFDLMLRLSRPGSKGGVDLDLLSSNVLRVLPYHAQPSGDPGDGQTWEDSFGETLTFSDDGALEKVELPAQNVVIRRSSEPLKPFVLEPPGPPPDAAGRLDSEDVVIRHDGVALAGAITRPRGTEGRLPAIFFISGSGGQDRNGMSAGIDLGTHQILDHLTEAGFLVLRVDDRGVGASHGPVEDLGYTDLVADARACVEFLFSRDDVATDRIALIGHSEGALTASILAAERPKVAAVVLMAPAGRSVVEVLYDQNVAALERAGLGEQERKKTLEEVRRNLDRIAGNETIEPGSLAPEYAPLLRNRRWVQEHARQDPVRSLLRVEAPILILHGAEDFQVSAEKDAGALAAALEHAGRRNFELRVFAGLDHLFKRVSPDGSSLADYFRDRPVDPGFLEVLTGWLQAHLAPTPDPGGRRSP